MMTSTRTSFKRNIPRERAVAYQLIHLNDLTSTNHFQEVSLQCGDSGQWLHLERAARPVNQTAVAVGFLQAEAKASRQDLEMANCKSSYAQRLRNKLCALTTSCLDLDR